LKDSDFSKFLRAYLKGHRYFPLCVCKL